MPFRGWTKERASNTEESITNAQLTLVSKVFLMSTRLPYILATALASFALTTACGDGEGGGGLTKDPTKLPEGVNVEAWSIDDRWYDYDFKDHSVTPAQKAHLIRHPELGDVLFSVIYYYDDDGVGRPTSAFRIWQDDAWGELRTWLPDARPGLDPQCMSFETFASAACDGNEGLVWRINSRPVPEMGFSVGNPGIFVTPREGLEVWEIPNYVVHERANLERLPESPQAALDLEGAVLRRTPLDSEPVPMLPLDRLAEGTSIFHLTADLRFTEFSVGFDAEAPQTVVLRSRCVTAEQSAATTADFTMEPTTLEIPLAERWTFVDVCAETTRACEAGETPNLRDTCVDREAAITEERSELLMGHWPDNRSFDLLFEKDETSFRVFVSPNTPFTANREADAFTNTPVPVLLWSEPDYR